jgi:hypothetical protein
MVGRGIGQRRQGIGARTIARGVQDAVKITGQVTIDWPGREDTLMNLGFHCAAPFRVRNQYDNARTARPKRAARLPE